MFDKLPFLMNIACWLIVGIVNIVKGEITRFDYILLFSVYIVMSVALYLVVTTKEREEKENENAEKNLQKS